MQCRGNPRVQQLRHQHPVAPAECGHQAQHCRGSHPGHRGAERQSQSGNRDRECRADRLQVGCLFQSEDGALERDNHAQEGAEHPQHHQQPHQIRRQRRAGQAGTLALDAQAHGILQRRMHAGQPVPKIGQVVGNHRQRGRQGGGRLAILAQFKRAKNINRTNDGCHRQRQETGVDEPEPYPGDPERPQNEDGCK